MIPCDFTTALHCGLTMVNSGNFHPNFFLEFRLQHSQFFRIFEYVGFNNSLKHLTLQKNWYLTLKFEIQVIFFDKNSKTDLSETGRPNVYITKLERPFFDLLLRQVYFMSIKGRARSFSEEITVIPLFGISSIEKEREFMKMGLLKNFVFGLRQRQRSLQDFIITSAVKVATFADHLIINQFNCVALALPSIRIAQHWHCLAFAKVSSTSISQNQHCLASALISISID